MNKATIVIESGIPAPTPGDRKPYSIWKNIFAVMKSGESFVVPIQDLATVRYSAVRYRERHDSTFIFTTRKISATEGRFWKL